MVYTIANNTITVILNGRVRVVHADNQLYTKLVDALRKGLTDLVETLVDKALKIKKHVSGKFDYDTEEGVIYKDGVPMPEVLSKDIIKFVEAGADVMPLLNFWNNLKDNPSESAKTDLYKFLTANHVPITEDGQFLAYRRVTEDYLDFYTHTVDNSLGSYVSMNREQVNPNRNQTCSTGYHVAAFNYADKIYHSGEGRLIEVIVNPADVVTVPPDYNDQKMRVCAYTVLRDCDGTEKQDLVVKEAGKNYRTYYLKNYKRPCKSMTMDDITSHKPAKAGNYACVRASTRDEAFQKFQEAVR